MALEAQLPHEAIPAFERALAARATPDSEGWFFEALRGLVLALRGAGRDGEVRAQVDRLLPLSSDDPRVRSLRVELLEAR